MITGERNGRSVTRNTSCAKKFQNDRTSYTHYGETNDDDLKSMWSSRYDNTERTNNHARQVRNRRSRQYLRDYVH
jgi:hypothetical protein